jgi:hypothetical protein
VTPTLLERTVSYWRVRFDDGAVLVCHRAQDPEVYYYWATSGYSTTAPSRSHHYAAAAAWQAHHAHLPATVPAKLDLAAPTAGRAFVNYLQGLLQ